MIHFLSKFGGDRHCRSDNIMILPNEKQDSTCWSNSTSTIFLLSRYKDFCQCLKQIIQQEIKYPHKKLLSMCPKTDLVRKKRGNNREYLKVFSHTHKHKKASNKGKVSCFMVSIHLKLNLNLYLLQTQLKSKFQ